MPAEQLKNVQINVLRCSENVEILFFYPYKSILKIFVFTLVNFFGLINGTCRLYRKSWTFPIHQFRLLSIDRYVYLRKLSKVMEMVTWDRMWNPFWPYTRTWMRFFCCKFYEYILSNAINPDYVNSTEEVRNIDY